MVAALALELSVQARGSASQDLTRGRGLGARARENLESLLGARARVSNYVARSLSSPNSGEIENPPTFSPDVTLERPPNHHDLTVKKGSRPVQRTKRRNNNFFVFFIFISFFVQIKFLNHHHLICIFFNV